VHHKQPLSRLKAAHAIIEYCSSLIPFSVYSEKASLEFDDESDVGDGPDYQNDLLFDSDDDTTAADDDNGVTTNN
jgi:hypothetical protein